MTREDVVRLWDQANNWGIPIRSEFVDELKHFAALVAAAERDRMCEQFNIPKELAHEKTKSNETD